jgi:hypothetical protein
VVGGAGGGEVKRVGDKDTHPDGPGGEACGRENIIKSETSYLIEEGYRKRRNLMDKASLQEYSERSSSYLQ